MTGSWWRRRYRVEAVAADGGAPLGVDTERRFWTRRAANWHAGSMNIIAARGGLVRYVVTDGR